MTGKGRARTGVQFRLSWEKLLIWCITHQITEHTLAGRCVGPRHRGYSCLNKPCACTINDVLVVFFYDASSFMDLWLRLVRVGIQLRAGMHYSRAPVRVDHAHIIMSDVVYHMVYNSF